MSATTNTLRNMKLLLTDVNERLEREGVLQVRQTLDIWSKLMSYLLQEEYSQAIPIRRHLQDHMRTKRHEKIHTFNLIIQRLDEVLDRYIPPPELMDASRKKGVTMTNNSLLEAEDNVFDDGPKKDKKSMEVPTTHKGSLRKTSVREDMGEIERLRKLQDESRKSVNLLRANESVLMTTVEDQQHKIKQLEDSVAFLEKQNAVLKGDMVSIVGEKDDEDRISVCSKAENEIKFLRKELKIKEQALELSLMERNKLLEKLSSTTSYRGRSRTRAGDWGVGELQRPTKLAEKFAELHDSEWTDALHILTLDQGLDDRTAIQWLLDLLFDSYAFCEQSSESYTRTLLEDGIYPFSNPGESKEVTSSQLDMVPMEIISELKKSVARITFLQIKQKFRTTENKSQRRIHDRKITNLLMPYLDKCLELCWYMVVQTPPICLDNPPYKTGEEFDRHLYRFYTTSGSKMDYIVWPALFLSRKGVVLLKGVAQPKPEGVALRISTHTKRHL